MLKNNTDTETVIKKSTEQIFAPVMYAYISWVLDQARRDKIQRLYFLARDGFQMYLAAKILCQERGEKIQCRYLKCSRYALRVPAYFLMGRDCLDLICQGGTDVTLGKVLKRSGLSREEIPLWARRLGAETWLDRILSYREVQKLKGVLAGSEGFLERIHEISREAYPAAAGYLRQEGLLEAIPYALVDSGWIGTLQQTLELLLKKEGKTEALKGFYFGLYEIPKGADREKYRAYYFLPTGKIKRKVYFCNSLFECVFSAPEGMTLHYRKEDKEYLPADGGRENPNKKQLETITEILCRRVRRLAKKNRKIKEKKVEKLLSDFMGYPAREEAEVFGGFHFTGDVLEKKGELLAAALSEKEIRNNHFFSKSLILLGLKKEPVQESSWIEGSVVNCGRHVKRHLRQIRLYKYLLYIRKALMERWK